MNLIKQLDDDDSAVVFKIIVTMLTKKIRIYFKKMLLHYNKKAGQLGFFVIYHFIKLFVLSGFISKCLKWNS